MPIALVIGALWGLSYAVETLARVLNLGALTGRPPAGFESVYSPAEYARSHAYTRARTRLALAESTAGLALFFLFWGAGGFEKLDGFLRGGIASDLPRGLLYVGTVAAGLEAFSLPFLVYGTFVVEEQFGFNRTSPATFVADLLKKWALGLALGGILLAGVLLLFMRRGAGAWVAAWGCLAGFTLLVQFIAPAWILPLFNTFVPLADGPLRESLFSYAGRVGFPLGNVFVMDGSKRSSKTNAFFTGFGKNRRIALFDTLIARHGPAEILSILAHEIGHYKMKHVVQGTVTALLEQGGMLYLFSLFLSRREGFDAFGLTRPSVYGGMALFALAWAPVNTFLGAARNTLSRRREYEADRYAARTAGGPAPLIAALKTLAAGNLAHLTPHPLAVFLSHSHPPLPARVERLSHGAG
jgi:STE24 endopeptidase